VTETTNSAFDSTQQTELQLRNIKLVHRPTSKYCTTYVSLRSLDPKACGTKLHSVTNDMAFPFLCLIEELLVSLLSDWVDVRSLGRLDSAMCSQEQRNHFLSILGANFSIRKRMDECPETEFCYEWLVLRKLRFQSISISYSPTPLLIVDLINVCGGLHTCSLSVCCSDETSVAVAAQTMSSSCTNVKELTIDCCDSWAGLTALHGEAQRSLKTLMIRTCETHRTIRFTRNAFSNLRKVTIHETEGEEHLTQSLANLFHAAPLLRDLTLWDIDLGNTGTALTGLIKHAGRLEKLWLYHCRGVSVSHLEALAQRCTSLKSLHFSSSDTNITDGSVKVFAAYCPELEELVLELGPFTHVALLSVANHCGAKLRCLELKCLHLAGDSGLVAVAERCVNLEELEIVDCSGITAECFVKLVTSPRQLWKLTIEDCDNVTDDVLRAIVDHIPPDVLVSLTRSTGYTDAGALAIANSDIFLTMCDSPEVPEQED
jgi:hypothetical protein